MSAYLDTQVTAWLAQGSLDRLSGPAKEEMEKTDLLVSPIVLLELEYLYEIKWILLPAEDILRKLRHEAGVRICRLDFPAVVSAGLHEKWTRDPFDRLIVAHAKANGLSPLISSDEKIRDNYPRTVW